VASDTLLFFSLLQVFSSYVYLLTDGSNTHVGILTGIGGLAQVLTAPLAGTLQTFFIV